MLRACEVKKGILSLQVFLLIICYGNPGFMVCLRKFIVKSDLKKNYLIHTCETCSFYPYFYLYYGNPGFNGVFRVDDKFWLSPSIVRNYDRNELNRPVKQIQLWIVLFLSLPSFLFTNFVSYFLFSHSFYNKNLSLCKAKT